MQKNSPEKVEIHFPTDFAFKVFVDPRQVEQTQLLQIVTSLLPRPDQLRKVTSRPSKTKKYISHTLVVTLESRSEMESLYAAFKMLKGVVYLL